MQIPLIYIPRKNEKPDHVLLSDKKLQRDEGWEYMSPLTSIKEQLGKQRQLIISGFKWVERTMIQSQNAGPFQGTLQQLQGDKGAD